MWLLCLYFQQCDIESIFFYFFFFSSFTKMTMMMKSESVFFFTREKFVHFTNFLYFFFIYYFVIIKVNSFTAFTEKREIINFLSLSLFLTVIKKLQKKIERAELKNILQPDFHKQFRLFTSKIHSVFGVYVKSSHIYSYCSINFSQIFTYFLVNNFSSDTSALYQKKILNNHMIFPHASNISLIVRENFFCSIILFFHKKKSESKVREVCSIKAGQPLVLTKYKKRM